MKLKMFCVSILSLMLLSTGVALAAEQPKDASSFTKNMNQQVLKQLPFADKQDYEDAKKGLIAPLESQTIKTDDGKTVVDFTGFTFYDGERPDTINPSAWRIGQLNNYAGLFKVADRIYQIRSLDLSNMTIIEGDTGLIIIDPLISVETAAAALKLYYDNVTPKGQPNKPIKAVIYSHSHIITLAALKALFRKPTLIAVK